MSDLVLKIKGEGDFPLDVDATLADLTGAETMMLEEFLGGWDKFELGGSSTRSVIVMVWLAKRQAGKTVSLEEIQQMKGLVFGDAFEVADADPPAVAATAAEPTRGSEAISEVTGVGV